MGCFQEAVSKVVLECKGQRQWPKCSCSLVDAVLLPLLSQNMHLSHAAWWDCTPPPSLLVCAPVTTVASHCKPRVGYQLNCHQ
jgi:hypothetical protein